MTRIRIVSVLLLVGIVSLAGCTGGSVDAATTTAAPTTTTPVPTATTTTGPPAVTSTFDADAGGWTVAGDAQDGDAEPDHLATGGDPGGHLQAADDVTGGVWYWSAAPAYLGDKSAYAGGTLSFSLKQSSTEDPFDSADVVLASGDVRLGYDFGNATTHPGTNWTAYEVPLRADGWTNLDTEESATAGEFRTVLGAVDELWIRGEYREGSDVGSLDTVELAG